MGRGACNSATYKRKNELIVVQPLPTYKPSAIAPILDYISVPEWGGKHELTEEKDVYFQLFNGTLHGEFERIRFRQRLEVSYEDRVHIIQVNESSWEIQEPCDNKKAEQTFFKRIKNWFK